MKLTVVKRHHWIECKRFVCSSLLSIAIKTFTRFNRDRGGLSNWNFGVYELLMLNNNNNNNNIVVTSMRTIMMKHNRKELKKIFFL